MYAEICHAIKTTCAKINLSYATHSDGRLASAMKEGEYLAALEAGLKASYPSLVFEHQPQDRWWWDFRVNRVPINLKLTVGGTDNAFNKNAIYYTLTGTELDKKNMNFNQFWKSIASAEKKTDRDPMTEYHYLAVNKANGEVLLKSILDIHSYKSNPCNILQINWANEFRQSDYVIEDSKHKEKCIQLLKTIQASVKQDVLSKKEFAEAVIEESF